MTAAALRLRAPATPWVAHLVALGTASLAVLAIRAGDAVDVATLWWTSSTYAHCLLVPFIIAWLISERMPALKTVTPHVWPGALAAPFAGALAILLGEAAGVATLRHLGLVLLLAGAVPALLGKAAARLLVFPLAYSVFLVPLGDEFVPALQLVTAQLCMVLLGLVGIPAHLEGVFITVPYGWFEVAEACSGVKFLVAMAALAVLVAHLCFRSWPRRILFVLFALVVPILANGLRAFATIWLASSQGVEAATGFDHLVYGWLFFAIVIAATLACAWPFFDRSAAERPSAPSVTREGARAGSPAPAALALMLAATIPGIWLGAGQAAAPASVLTVPDVPGWTRLPLAAGGEWTPRFAGADSLLRARYKDASGAQVDLVLAHYAAQADGRELVGFGQGLDPDWSWSGEGAPVANGRADRFTSPQAGREVLSFHRLGGFTTGDPARVKWLTLQARLLRRSSAGTALLLSSASPGPPAASRPAIDRFLAAAGGPGPLLPR